MTMAEIEAMDVDQEAGFHNYKVWFFPGLAATSGLLNLRQVDYKGLTLDKVKELIIEEDKKRLTEGVEARLRQVDDFDLLYNGDLLKNSAPDNTLKLRPEAVLYVIKRAPSTEVTEKAQEAAAFSPQMIKDLSLALRDAFLRTNFIKVIEKLADPETLQNVFAVAPGLEKDLMGIAIIQTPQLMFQISDREMLQRVANSRPWLIEALKHIVATVQAERAAKPGRISGGLAAEFLNSAFLDGGGEEDDDEMDDDEAEPPRTQSQPNFRGTGPITREQLAQALSTIPNFLRGMPSPSATDNQFANLFNPANAPGPSRPTTAPPATANSTGFNPTFQQLLQNAFGAVANSANNPTGQNLPTGSQPPAAGLGTNPATPAITAETFTRALQMAISHLPPEARADQFERVRQMAQQVVAGNPLPGFPQQPPAVTTAAVPVAEVPATPTAEYHRELAQMRELGITDERLSILALRVSEGDVETAVDLILSGWDGAGAEGP